MLVDSEMISLLYATNRQTDKYTYQLFCTREQFISAQCMHTHTNSHRLLHAKNVYVPLAAWNLCFPVKNFDFLFSLNTYAFTHTINHTYTCAPDESKSLHAKIVCEWGKNEQTPHFHLHLIKHTFNNEGSDQKIIIIKKNNNKTAINVIRIAKCFGSERMGLILVHKNVYIVI